MAVDGVGRLEWAEKILVWKTRLGVSFHVLPQSLASRVAGDTRDAFRDLNFLAGSAFPTPPSPPLPAVSPYLPTFLTSPTRPGCPPHPAPPAAQTCASEMRTVPRMLSTAKIRTGSWR